ncbi:hypothetical protein B0T26DRAFT_522578 [Lasiosphaeria miniovina]|uniref:Uncharacterized protein n=1 Tax=Lasiosphaeria miniovina TaxID=1954250 RepID=A0AA39ZV23_9PEZI|nr:uncharacterized protein B0T26DRAFT_522578 [Lasiosphaeria miniovina]KAK0704064.1 hypothetical protein B0T26DRAFT_522578 [Lasiosphaeria miniovina]
MLFEGGRDGQWRSRTLAVAGLLKALCQSWFCGISPYPGADGGKLGGGWGVLVGVGGPTTEPEDGKRLPWPTGRALGSAPFPQRLRRPEAPTCGDATLEKSAAFLVPKPEGGKKSKNPFVQPVTSFQAGMHLSPSQSRALLTSDNVHILRSSLTMAAVGIFLRSARSGKQARRVSCDATGRRSPLRNRAKPNEPAPGYTKQC